MRQMDATRKFTKTYRCKRIIVTVRVLRQISPPKGETLCILDFQKVRRRDFVISLHRAAKSFKIF